MPEAFDAGHGPLVRLSEEQRTVLVTGARGHIGSYFAEHAPRRYQLRLMVEEINQEAVALRQHGEVVQGNLADLDRLKALCAGIDTVVHLAADPNPSATWESILPNNIIGTYNMMVAAKSAGCRRLIYASSIHAVSGYPADVQVKESEPVNPGDIYGVSKCFGEALGRYMAEQEGVSVICLRIGAFQPVGATQGDQPMSMIDSFVSRRDLTQLMIRVIDAEDLRFAIFHALSNNRFKRLDISQARDLLGYDPEDDITVENPALAELHLRDTVTADNATDSGQQSGIRQDV